MPRVHVRSPVLGFGLLLIGAAAAAQGPPATRAADAPVLRRDETPLADVPFVRYFTTDAHAREITFYLCESKDAPGPLPLVVYVQGSGCQSNFMELGGRVVCAGPHGLLLPLLAGKAHLLIVEKPGVPFLFAPPRPGGADGASEEFLREHTLPRWSAAIGAALRAARTLPCVDPARTLVVGHSEGGLVACRVAAENPFVTHVGCLAGGGPTQLFDLIELARRGDLYKHAGDRPDERIAALLRDWDAVLADPLSTSKTFLGHPNCRWSSFLADSPLHALRTTDARVFLAQGTADRAVSVLSYDVLFAELKALGRDVTGLRIEGGDHGFATDPKESGRGEPMQRVLGRVVDWFLDGDASVDVETAQRGEAGPASAPP